MGSHPSAGPLAESPAGPFGCNCRKEIERLEGVLITALAEMESRLSAKLDSILSSVGPKVATAVRIKFEPQ